MEKRCGFCMELSPIVYCKADAAYLCLSCDAKVHSANALSFRHPRTLLCESCRCGPAIVRCCDHRMFMCQSCDDTIHHLQQHKKMVITCYVGCPSAEDLASLWGFDFNHLTDTESQGTKQESSFLILQQIMYLEKLQTSEGIDGSCLLQHVNDGLPSFRHDIMSKVHKNIDNSNEHFDGDLDFQNSESRLEEKTHDEHLSSPSPFSQIESGNPLYGDSFWQNKSPAHNNEIWLQNMQDLGVCDEARCFDDVIIPDVDFTFRNFEELYGNEHEPNRAVIDDKDMDCSDRGYARIFEDIEKEIDGYDQAHQLQTINHSPYSAFTGESSVSEYRDDGLYPTFHDHLLPHGPYDSGKTKPDGKNGTFTMGNKEKKVLRQEKQGHYTSPKSKSDFKKRGKGQVFEDRWQ